jgi:hypothetical protein
MVIIALVELEYGYDYSLYYLSGSIADPDPPNPHVLRPSGSGSFFH